MIFLTIEIEISMNKESSSPETTGIEIQVDSEESNNLEIDEKSLSKDITNIHSRHDSIKKEIGERDYNKQKSVTLYTNPYKQANTEDVELDSKSSPVLKTSTLNSLTKSQSVLTKCNSAPPPAPFSIFNSANLKNSTTIQTLTKQSDLDLNEPTSPLSSSKSNALQQSVSSSLSTPISSSRRLGASMSAKLYCDQSDHSSNSYHTHQSHHHHNNSAVTVAAAAAVALNHATITANLNKYASNYSLQKDVSSTYSQPMYAYSQFYPAQHQNSHLTLQQQSQQLQKNASNNNLEFYQQTTGFPLYVHGSHNTNHFYSSASSSSNNNLLPHHQLSQVSSKQPFGTNTHGTIVNTKTSSSSSSSSSSSTSSSNSFSGNNPYQNLNPFENSKQNTNKTTALAAAAALAAAFASKSNGTRNLSQQSLLRRKPSDIKNGIESSYPNKIEDYEYDSPDDENNSNNMYYQAKDHAVQTFNLLQHSNHSAIRHIPSSAVDQLELSDEIESLVSRDLIKRCIRKAKHRGNFAANLTAELFSKEERISCNCTGTRGKRQLSPRRLNIVKEITFKIYNSNAATAAVLAAAASGNSSSAVAAANSAYQDFEEAWRKECITAIDAKNRSIGRDIIKINLNSNTSSNSANSNQTNANNVINNSNLNMNEQNISSPYSNSNSNHPNETSE